MSKGHQIIVHRRGLKIKLVVLQSSQRIHPYGYACFIVVILLRQTPMLSGIWQGLYSRMTIQIRVLQ